VVIEVVLIDWGDTLMADLPGNADLPMADWPRVEMMPHAAEAVARVKERWPVYVATNTDLSDAPLVLAALERVGLADLVDGVFASLDIGAAKPEEAFFDAVLDTLGLLPNQAVMAGDTYENDVAGPKRVGLWTVWYNPGRAASPAGEPRHDVEIADLRHLPAAIDEVAGLAEQMSPRPWRKLLRE
jgi:HAD superfamily hydrolase (TIGR01509 family)